MPEFSPARRHFGAGRFTGTDSADGGKSCNENELWSAKAIAAFVEALNKLPNMETTEREDAGIAVLCNQVTGITGQ